MESTTNVPSRTGIPTSRDAAECRLLVSGAADGATNMATDEALLRRVQRTGETIYRVYSWSRPTVSLGRHQSARESYDLELAQRRGIDFVRRPTGGRAILHDREITYSVAASAERFGSLRESYRAVNRLLLEALRTLGVDACEADPSTRTPTPSLAPCFHAPVAGELVVDGQKLVGSAQVRDGDAFLQHGSILVDDDQQLLTELLGGRDSGPPPATLRALTGRVVTVREFSLALDQALLSRHAAPPLPLHPEQPLLDDIESLVRTRYSTADWTWRH